MADVMAPLNRVGDAIGSRLDEKGRVTTPPGFREAYRQYVAAGWGAVPFDPEFGGGGFPWLVTVVMQELLTDIWEQHQLTVLFVTHDVEEAVFISDRVLVMTNRPGRIKKEVRVDLERPRHYDMLASARFGELFGEVLESIREESIAQDPARVVP